MVRRIIQSVISSVRRVRGPGLHRFVGRVPPRGGTCDALHRFLQLWFLLQGGLTYFLHES